MSAITELYGSLCQRLNEMHVEMLSDIRRIKETEKDWWLRGHKIDVRRALYTLETSDLERQRWSLLKDLAVAELYKANPIVVMTVP